MHWRILYYTRSVRDQNEAENGEVRMDMAHCCCYKAGPPFVRCCFYGYAAFRPGTRPTRTETAIYASFKSEYQNQ